LVGAHTVNIHRSTCNNIQATLAVTITESGKILTPVSVFKGMPGGHIAKLGFRYLSMWVHLGISVYSLDGRGSYASVDGADVEALHCTFACCYSFAFRFLWVPNNGFGCSIDQ